MIDFPNVNPQKADVQQFFYNRGPYTGAGGSSTIPVNSFAEYVWHKPSGISFVYGLIINAGGGGGGGFTGSGGGGGGGRGSPAITFCVPAICVPDTLRVIVGQGGVGGAALSPGRAGNPSGLISNTYNNSTATATGAPGHFPTGSFTSTYPTIFATAFGNGGGSAGSAGAGGGAGTITSNSARNVIHVYALTNLQKVAAAGGGPSAAGGSVPNISTGTLLPAFVGGGAGGGGQNGTTGFVGGSQYGWEPATQSFPNVVGPNLVQPSGDGVNGLDGIDGFSLKRQKFYASGGNGGNGNPAGAGGKGGKGGIGCGGGGGGAGSTVGGAGGDGGDGYVLLVSW